MYIYPTRQGCTLNEVEVSKMKKKFFMGLFLIGTLVFSSFVSAGWFADLFDEDKSLVGQAYIKEGGTVKEQIKCVFKDTTSTQICSSTKGSCKGEVQKDNTGRTYVSCGVEVIGKQGEQLTWKSSCGGYATTIIDGQDEGIEFKCENIQPGYYQAYLKYYY